MSTTLTVTATTRLSTVREATMSDLPYIYQHAMELANYHDAKDSFKMTFSDLLKAFESGLIHALVIDGSTQASAVFSYTFSTWSGRRNVYLEHLYVSPACRGSGYGATLVRALQTYTDGRVELSVKATNVSACKFYVSLGGRKLDGWDLMRI